NMHWQACWFELPQPTQGKRWHLFANTSVPSPQDSYNPGTETPLENQQGCLLGDRSVVILVAK
ncbi:MAG: hypothetical protein ACKN9E_18305, partial [Microcystaceae cyanobacterium]